jgi:hypothetical protein
MFESIESFTGADPNADVALEAIRPYSHRAYSLMIRNRTKRLPKRREHDCIARGRVRQRERAFEK